MVLPQCGNCTRFHFYPRPYCPHCGSSELEWREASGEGTLYSYTIAHIFPGNPTDPVILAAIELSEGPRMLANLVDIGPEDPALELDLPLSVTFVVKEGRTVPAFRPSGAPGSGAKGDRFDERSRA